MESDDPVEMLRRWEDAGARWAVISRTAESATVGLYRCDGGEEMDRVTSSEPAFLAYLAGRGGYPAARPC